MIDRYDARALLTDLKLFDRQAGRWDALPRTRKPSDPKHERELKLNKKLDKERYWDMVLHGEDIYKGIIVRSPLYLLRTFAISNPIPMPRACLCAHSSIPTSLRLYLEKMRSSSAPHLLTSCASRHEEVSRHTPLT